MKKILLIITLLIFSLSYAQKQKVEVLRYKEVTTVERDAYVVPAGEFWRIYNTTTSQHEFWDGDSWKILGFQDISGKADKSNVLELDNTDIFTPTLDYHPSTKKYVDDNTGGGGGEIQLHERQGFIDVTDIGSWHGLDTEAFYRTEWDISSGVAKSSSIAGAADSSLKSPIGIAFENQTVVSLKVTGAISQSNITHVGVLKVTWNDGHTATTAKTLLYQTDSVIFTNNVFDVSSISFTETSIGENDWIYVLFATNTLSDRNVTVQLKCSID